MHLKTEIVEKRRLARVEQLKQKKEEQQKQQQLDANANRELVAVRHDYFRLASQNQEIELKRK